MHRTLSRAALAAVALLMLSLPTPPQAGAASTGSITVRAVGDRDPVNGDPVPLAGAPFTAYADDALTTAMGSCTTGLTGACSIGGLGDGTYWVAPAGDLSGGAVPVISRPPTAPPPPA